jgi:hypothetical protein
MTISSCLEIFDKKVILLYCSSVVESYVASGAYGTVVRVDRVQGVGQRVVLEPIVGAHLSLKTQERARDRCRHTPYGRMGTVDALSLEKKDIAPYSCAQNTVSLLLVLLITGSYLKSVLCNACTSRALQMHNG